MASERDLTTLAAVREYLQKKPAETAQDEILAALITRASELIMRESGREFAPAQDGLERSFAYRGGGMVDLAPYDLRAASAVAVSFNGTSETLPDADYALRPLPAADGVHRWIELVDPRRLARRAARTPGRVTVTGDWGFGAVPADVEQACIVTVTIWARRDVQAFSATYSIDEARLERPEALPSAVRGMLRKWRYPVIG